MRRSRRNSRPPMYHPAMMLDERGIAETTLRVGHAYEDEDELTITDLTLEVSVAALDDPTIEITFPTGERILFGWSTLAAALAECEWSVIAHGNAGDPSR